MVIVLLRFCRVKLFTGCRLIFYWAGGGALVLGHSCVLEGGRGQACTAATSGGINVRAVLVFFISFTVTRASALSTTVSVCTTAVTRDLYLERVTVQLSYEHAHGRSVTDIAGGSGVRCGLLTRAVRVLPSSTVQCRSLPMRRAVDRHMSYRVGVHARWSTSCRCLLSPLLCASASTSISAATRVGAGASLPPPSASSSSRCIPRVRTIALGGGLLLYR